jgi:hypothetical protein
MDIILIGWEVCVAIGIGVTVWVDVGRIVFMTIAVSTGGTGVFAGLAVSKGKTGVFPVETVCGVAQAVRKRAIFTRINKVFFISELLIH